MKCALLLLCAAAIFLSGTVSGAYLSYRWCLPEMAKADLVWLDARAYREAKACADEAIHPEKDLTLVLLQGRYFNACVRDVVARREELR